MALAIPTACGKFWKHRTMLKGGRIDQEGPSWTPGGTGSSTSLSASGASDISQNERAFTFSCFVPLGPAGAQSRRYRFWKTSM